MATDNSPAAAELRPARPLVPGIGTVGSRGTRGSDLTVLGRRWRPHHFTGLKSLKFQTVGSPSVLPNVHGTGR
jgi:hypothetical protein